MIADDVDLLIGERVRQWKISANAKSSIAKTKSLIVKRIDIERNAIVRKRFHAETVEEEFMYMRSRDTNCA